MTAHGRERFLRELAARVTPERIGEAYLFPAIRAGGTESGVAVLAVHAEAPTEGAPAPEKYVVVRAQYRLTLKGPERGTWELTLTEEADAPADTIEAVVHGVQRRAGEDDPPERLTAEHFRAVLASEPLSAPR